MRTSLGKNVARRRGYTLMEMLIVMSVTAGLVASGWPVLRGPMAKSKLQNAAKQVRTELLKTRLDAIEAGERRQFRVQLNKDEFEIADQKGAASRGSHRDDSESYVADEEEGVHRHRLLEGILFADPSADELPAALADRASSDASTIELETDVDLAEWSRAIVFEPDGRTRDTRIRLVGYEDFYVDVTLRGLTGSVSVGELKRFDTKL